MSATAVKRKPHPANDKLSRFDHSPDLQAQQWPKRPTNEPPLIETIESKLKWLLVLAITAFALVHARSGWLGGQAAATHSSFGLGRDGRPLPDLFTATLDDLRGGLEAGTFTSVDLVTAYLARTHQASQLRAVQEINPVAYAQAREADAARRAGREQGALAGIPISLKDNVATARPDSASMNTTAGSYALLGSVPAGDATIVTKLLDAGAIVIGKTALSEWANYRSNWSNSSNGWSARGGQVLSAYYPDLDPIGSSSGSGVAADIGLAWAAVGTETMGSIISPGQRNNLCAIKPTVGLTSRFRVIPISGKTQDTVGPMARTCKDAAALLSVLVGRDENDEATSVYPFDKAPDYVAACKISALKGAKLGVPNNFLLLNNATDEQGSKYPEFVAFNNSLSVFRKLGASVNEQADFPDLAAYEAFRQSNEFTLAMDVEFQDGIKAWFDGLISNPNGKMDLKELLHWTHTHAEEHWPDRDTAIWERALARGLTTDSPEYLQQRQRNLDFYGSKATILGAIEDHDLDALILPSSFATGFSALAGYPVVTVPLGFYPADIKPVYNARGLATTAPHMPFGLSFVGRRFSEEKLIAYAYAFEQATKVRDQVKPYLLPSFQLIDAIHPGRTLDVGLKRSR